MKRIVAGLLILTLALTLAASITAKDSIVICSSAEQFRNDALQEELNKRFPQYNVVVMYMPTGKAATKILTEGTHTEVDILVGLESGYLSKLQDNLANIEGLSRIPYLEGLEPAANHNRWVTWERFAGAIIVNRDILDKNGLPVPTGYTDLLKPEYRNFIAMPDPKSSGTGYFYYKNWVNTMGEEKALAYVDALYNNVKQFTESGSGPIKLLIQGEAAVALGMTFQAVNEINNGMPFEILYPEEGSPYSLTGTAMIEGKQNKKGVSEIFDYIINEFIVYDKENFSPEAIMQHQVNNIPHYPQNIQYADMTGIDDIEEKERLLALWKY